MSRNESELGIGRGQSESGDRTGKAPVAAINLLRLVLGRTMMPESLLEGTREKDVSGWKPEEEVQQEIEAVPYLPVDISALVEKTSTLP